MYFEIEGTQLNKLSVEEKKALEAKLSAELKQPVVLRAKKEVAKFGFLQDKLDENHNFACSHCGAKTNYDELDEEDQALARKHGWCHKCAEAVRIAEKIKAVSPKRTVIRDGDSAAQQVKNIIAEYSDQINVAFMAKLSNKDFASKNMGLRYPLFKELPNNLTTEQLKDFVCDDFGKRRFGAVQYRFKQIAGKTYLMTNDIYKKNVGRTLDTFKAFLDGKFEDAKPSINLNKN